MSSKHLVDPELEALLELLPTVAFSTDLLPMIRSRSFPIQRNLEIEEQVALESRSVPGGAGTPDVPLRIYRPRAAAGLLPCILHLHGGGFVTGSAAMMDPAHRALSLEAHCAIVSVDYRLAPEVPFPGGVEDCYAVLAWLFDSASILGVDVNRIGVMGESAGGGLAAALALLARDRKRYSLAFQHLIYPMLDDRTCVDPEPHPYTGEFLWTRHNNAFGWSALLGAPPGGPHVSMYAAPARATDLSRLPPAFISSGALDLFLDEDLEYARRLIRAGVSVEMHVYPGAFHGFDMAPDARVAAAARRDSRDALRRMLHSG